MLFRNSTSRYGLIARVLHWTSVGLMLMSVMLGIEIQTLPAEKDAVDVIARHSAFGLLLLGVMVARCAWRMQNLNPLYAYATRPWPRRFALCMHWSIYLLVISECCIGLAHMLFSGTPISLFGFQLLTTTGCCSKLLLTGLDLAHQQLAPLIYIAILFHITLAMYHLAFADPPADAQLASQRET